MSDATQPRWASAAVCLERSGDGLASVLETVRSALEGAPPDVCFAFCSGADPERERRLLDGIRDALAPGVLCGCGAQGVIGGGREIEAETAVAVLAGVLPGARWRPFRVGPGEASSTIRGADGAFSDDGVREAGFVVFCDPWTADVESLVQNLDQRFPGNTKIGGLASGGRGAGEGSLYLDGAIHRDGSVGLMISGGGWVLDAVVAQGCRPIGHPLFVTRAQSHWILELDGRSATEVLRELWEGLSERDQQLAQQSLFLGIEMHPALSEYRRGDFLVRNLVGADPERGGIAIGATVGEGQVVQFHLRDARTSDEDLKQRLAHYRADLDDRGASAEAALLFSCVGRGEGLYGVPHHDSATFLRQIGGIPLGGFFCNGEIGPVAGRTFLHAYTSAFGVFRRVR